MGPRARPSEVDTTEDAPAPASARARGERHAPCFFPLTPRRKGAARVDTRLSGVRMTTSDENATVSTADAYDVERRRPAAGPRPVGGAPGARTDRTRGALQHLGLRRHGGHPARPARRDRARLHGGPAPHAEPGRRRASRRAGRALRAGGRHVHRAADSRVAGGPRRVRRRRRGVDADDGVALSVVGLVAAPGLAADRGGLHVAAHDARLHDRPPRRTS